MDRYHSSGRLKKKKKMRRKRDWFYITKIHILFSLENELGFSSEEESESDSEDEV